ncbi:hypothetical protein KSS87_016901, partial [Heliosperma pusillum]
MTLIVRLQLRFFCRGYCFLGYRKRIANSLLLFTWSLFQNKRT